jgi:hypothetical protein
MTYPERLLASEQTLSPLQHAVQIAEEIQGILGKTMPPYYDYQMVVVWTTSSLAVNFNDECLWDEECGEPLSFDGVWESLQEYVNSLGSLLSYKPIPPIVEELSNAEFRSIEEGELDPSPNNAEQEGYTGSHEA